MVARETIKWLLFPGTNLHGRLRRRVLPPFFNSCPRNQTRRVLDAGCGNGMLSYASYRLGNHVVGISIKEKEVEGCRRLFNRFLGIPEERLSFRNWNIYRLAELGVFDEIICSEVLEHLERDDEVCRLFWSALKPGGILHLCCPNAEHPHNRVHELDRNEAGGHVRSGYTLEAYKALLEPVGFQVSDSRGLGGPIRQAFNKRIIQAEQLWWPLGFPIMLLALPFVWLDPNEPSVPYSLYVRAVKPA